MSKVNTFFENYNKKKGITENDSFQSWFSTVAKVYNLDPNPNLGSYDYKAAYNDGVRKPDSSGHWPSKYKKVEHPNLIVDGVNTKTGAKASKTDLFFKGYYDKKRARQEFVAKEYPNQFSTPGYKQDPRLAYSGQPGPNVRPATPATSPVTAAGEKLEPRSRVSNLLTSGGIYGKLTGRLPMRKEPVVATSTQEGTAVVTPTPTGLPSTVAGGREGLIDEPGYYKGERIDDILKEFGPTQKKSDVLRLLKEGKLAREETIGQAKEAMPKMSEADRIRMIGEDQTDYMYGEYVKDLNNFYTKWQNIKDNPAQLVPFLSGAVEAKHIIDLSQAVSRFEDGTETIEDIDLLQNYLEQSQKDATFAYKVFDVLAMLPAFAGEFAATSGIYTLAKKGTIEAVEKLAKKWLTGAGKKVLEKKIADRLAVKILGGLVGATAQAPLAGVTRITASTIENMIPNFEYYKDEQDQLKLFFTDEGDSLGLALAKAFGEQWVETASEKSGGVLKEVKIFNTIAQKTKDQLFKVAFIKKFAQLNPGSTLADFNKLLKRAGWNGVIAEMGEERVADIGHGLLESAGLGDQAFKLPSKEDLAVELVAFSVPGAAIGIAKKAISKKIEPPVEEPARGDTTGVDRGQVPPDEPPPPGGPAVVPPTQTPPPLPPGQQPIQKPEEPGPRPVTKPKAPEEPGPRPVTKPKAIVDVANAENPIIAIEDVARESNTAAEFKSRVLGPVGDSTPLDSYIEPITLTNDQIADIKSTYAGDGIDLETIEGRPHVDNSEGPLVIDEDNNVLSGLQKIIDALYNDTLNLKAIRVISAGKVKAPGKNQLKISELYSGAKKQRSLFEPKKGREEKPKVYRGQPAPPAAGPKIAKPRPVPKKKAKEVEPKKEGEEPAKEIKPGKDGKVDVPSLIRHMVRNVPKKDKFLVKTAFDVADNINSSTEDQKLVINALKKAGYKELAHLIGFIYTGNIRVKFHPTYLQELIDWKPGKKKETPQGKVPAEKVPVKRKRITHFTKEENIDKILTQGFDASLPPVHGVGGLEGGKKTKKLGKDVLYFTTDNGRWDTATIYVGEGKGDISRKAYDYDNQKWVDEKNAYKKVSLKPVEADIKEDAKILNINSYAAAKKFLEDNGKSVDTYEFMEDVLATAKNKGYDIVHVDGRIDKAWEMPDGKTTKFGDKSWYKLLTGNSGKSDYFILNKNAIDIVKPEKAPVKTAEKEESKKKEGGSLEGKEIRDKFNKKGSGHARMLGQLARLVDEGSLAKEEMDLLLNIFLNTKDNVLVPLKISPSSKMTRAGGNFKADVVRGRTREESLENKRNLKLTNQRIAIRTGIVDRIMSGEWKLGDTGMKIFLHEFGHYGYYFFLTNEERALVDRVFRSMTKTQRMKHFERGFHKGNEFGQRYGSKNVREFFAETFAFYVKANKAPHSALEKIYSHLKKELKQALKYLSGKQNNNIEKLAWLYEKVLTGDKTITEADVKEMFTEREETPEKQRDKGTPTKAYYSPTGGISQEEFEKELKQSKKRSDKSETIANRRDRMMATIASKARKAKRFEEFVNGLTLLEKLSVKNRMNDKEERRALAMYYRLVNGPNPPDEALTPEERKKAAIRKTEKELSAQERIAQERIDKKNIERNIKESKTGIAEKEFDRQADLATDFKGVENVEMFSLYRELTNFGKVLLNNSKAYYGYFMAGSYIKDYKGRKIGAEKTGYHISLNRILFLGKNSAEKIGKTMAHELGHMFDFLPNNLMEKGNLLGRLYTLSYQFMGSFIDDMRVVDRSRKILNELLPAAYAELEKNPDSVGVQNKIDRLQNEYSAIKDTSKIIIGDIKAELVKVSKIMRPSLWQDNRPSKVEYRHKPSELYADYISALLTNPDMAMREAPLFSSRFFDMMDNKPDVKRALLEIQQLLGGIRADLLEMRAKHIMEMFKRSSDAVEANLRVLRAGHIDIVDKVRSSFMYRWEFTRNLYTDFLRFKRTSREAFLSKNDWARVMYNRKNKEFDQNPDINPVFFMGKHDYIGNKVRTNLYRHFQPFYNKMNKYGLTTDEVSTALFLDRIGKDKKRESLPNPLGHDKVSANELLRYLQKNWGKEKADKIFEIAKGLREGLLDTFLEYEDLFSIDQIAYIKVMRASGRENFYAPFNTAYNLAFSLPAGLYHQTGNLNDTNDIVHNILLKNIGVVYAGERNKLHNNIVMMLGRMFPDEIKKAKMKPEEIRVTDTEGISRIITISVPIETTETGKGNLYVLENGQRKLYYISSQITDSIKHTPAGYSKQITDVGNTITQFIKHSYTVFSPGFQAVNFFFRDLQKSLKTFRMVEGAKKGIFGHTWNPAMHLKAFAQLLRYYYKAAPHAIKFEKGQYTDRILKMLDRGTLIVDYHGRGRILESLDDNEMDNIKRSLRKLGVRIDNNAGKKITAKSILKRTVKTLIAPWLGLSKLGGVAEAIPKIAGDIYLQEQAFFDSEAKTDDWIRNNVGSPNFKKKSALNAELNFFAIFYNATIRGIESSLDLLTNPKSRSAVWWGLVYFTILPTIYQSLLEAGDDDDDRYGSSRDNLLMRKITEFHKNNTLVFPVKEWEGDTFFIKVPMSEENRFIHVLTRMATLIIIEEEKKKLPEVAAGLGRSVLYAGEQLPSANPLLEIGLATMDVLNDKNPVDWFTGDQMFNELKDKNQMNLPKKEKLKMLGKWALEKAGMRTYLNLIPGASKLLDRDIYPERKTWLKEITRNPLFSRFVGLTSAGEREYEEKLQKPEAQAATMRARNERQAINKAVIKYYQEKVTNPEMFFNKNVMETLMTELEYKYKTEDRDKLADDFQLALIRTSAGIKIKNLSYYNSLREKAIVLANHKKKLPASDFDELVKVGEKTGVINSALREEVNKILMEEYNKKARE